MASQDAALPADEFRRDAPRRGEPLRGGRSGNRRATDYASAADRTRVGASAADTSDTALLASARRGDRVAFGRLVERHHLSLAAILRPRCGTDVPLEDLVQEVFARALANLGAFRSDASFLTWATSIGLHLATDWRRTGERRRRLAPTVDVADEEPADRGSGGAVADAERRDELDRARRAIDALPSQMRIAVTLRIVEDVSYDEIAARLRAPAPRVRQWVCRGLTKLRAALEDRHGA